MGSGGKFLLALALRPPPLVKLDAVVKQSTHSADDPEVLGLIPIVITAADPAITRSRFAIHEVRKAERHVE